MEAEFRYTVRDATKIRLEGRWRVVEISIHYNSIPLEGNEDWATEEDRTPRIRLSSRDTWPVRDSLGSHYDCIERRVSLEDLHALNDATITLDGSSPTHVVNKFLKDETPETYLCFRRCLAKFLSQVNINRPWRTDVAVYHT